MNECENQNDWLVKFLSSGPLGPLYQTHSCCLPSPDLRGGHIQLGLCHLCLRHTILVICWSFAPLSSDCAADKHFGFGTTLTERPVNTKEEAAWVGYNSKPLGVSDLWESDSAPTEIRGRLSMGLNGTVVRSHARTRACRAVVIGSDGEREPSLP